ncbi:MAG TPA: glycoside hydrolase family 38 C-terminal domain-containing protein [Bacteroidota bacterium]|nr:glycoside hydrolase family 38 C-terminal domain-containing protein [Bacteroidota bacterium]
MRESLSPDRVYVVLIALILVVPGILRSQTPVDRLVRTLDSLSSYSINDWKASPDLKSKIAGNPALPGFDDSRWDNLRLDEKIYPDSCWIRKEIVMPEQILGRPVSGAVRLKLSVDDYGFLWVNGEAKGYFPWDGDFELTNDARPGQKFLVAVKAINTGGPLRLIRAGIEPAVMQPLKDKIADFMTSIRVGQKLLGFDTYQTNSHRKIDPGIDKSAADRAEKIRLNDLLQSAASAVDADALADGDTDRFMASLEKARAELKPAGEFAKRYTLWFDANAHIDAAWLWREGETVEVCRNTFTSVLNMMDARADFTYTQSSAAYYDWMERRYPDVFKRITERIRDGRWEIVGGMWVEPDCNLPGGESWMRHVLYGKRYFRKKFGVDVKIGYNPDSFGYNLNMPQFYADAGIDAFVTQKIGWSETNVFPYRVFWWESPDGSRILAYFPFDYVNTIDDPYKLTEQLRQFESNTGFTQMLTLFGVGDHGGGPTPDMLARLDHLKTLDIYPQVKLGTLTAYLDWLKGNDLAKVPVWKDELYLEYHQGTFTTQSETKKFNRETETLLLNAEKFSTIASLHGRPYRAGDMSEAWENVLFNQFHDILPGSGIREIYIDAAERYRASERIGNFELTGSLKTLADRVKAAPFRGGIPVTVFNPLNWERPGPVTVALPDGDDASYGVFDDAGNELPSQVLRKDKYGRDLLFMAKGIPSMGYRVYLLAVRTPSPGKASPVKSNLASTGRTLSNGILEVAIDPASGWIGSIVDKRNGREILSGEGNRLQLLEDQPRAWDAWNVGLTGVEYPTRLAKIEVVEEGPVRATVRVTREYLKPGVTKDLPTPDYPSSFFVQDISLYDGLDYVSFKTGADWWEEKTMLKVAFPVAVRDTAATYEIPYGTIRRSTLWRDSRDSAKVEVPAQRWADLSGADYGVSLLNRAKYGYDIKDNVMRLSLLRSPKWPDPTADRGMHEMEYALYPHAGDWKDANTVRRGYEYNNPLIAQTRTATGKTSTAGMDSKPAGATGGKSLPASGSFVGLEPENLILTGLKKAEDSDAWIVQWYESEGKETEAVLTLPAAPKSAVISDFLEGDRGPLHAEGKVLKVKTRAAGMRTVKITF